MEAGAFVFDIDFRDICWDSALHAGQFTSSAYTYNLWEQEDLIFAEMADLSQGTLCGGYTYVLEY